MQSQKTPTCKLDPPLVFLVDLKTPYSTVLHLPILCIYDSAHQKQTSVVARTPCAKREEPKKGKKGEKQALPTRTPR
jgi:hypothetical protein